MKFTINILRVISVLSLLYALMIIFVSGRKTSFLGFWFALSAGCTVFSFLLSYLLHHTSPHFHRCGIICVILMWCVVGVFIVVESFIIMESQKPAASNAEYVIVLGAQVRNTVPSKTLEMRIKAAAEYLTENPSSKVICSGGQGLGESITEANAIQNGLISLGISPKRILLESCSTNTVENLAFCKEMINSSSKVVIVTSDFHIFRAKKIAEHLGYTNISMCSANEFMVTTISYYVREFFALTKDYFVGNLR